MSLALTKRDAAAILGVPFSESGAGPLFEGVHYDPTQIRGGELYISLPGAAEERAEALKLALARGAALVLCDEASVIASDAELERILIVSDVPTAFGKLAQWWRRELAVPLMGVAGSLGKSSIKEIAAALLLRIGQGVYSPEGARADISVPSTLCRASRDHLWAVLEMPADAPDVLRRLGEMSEPDVAVLGRVAPARVKAYGGLEQLAAAQFEITSGLRTGGWLVVNRDDPLQCRALAALPQSLQERMRFYGSSEGCEARVSGVRSFGLEGIEFTLHLLGEELPITMRVLGRHFASTAAAAALGAKLLRPELSGEQIASGLTGFTAPFMKVALQRLKGGRRVLDESAEANPVSMAAVLETARDLMAENLRVGLLLGDMLDIGPQPEVAHDKVGALLAALKPGFVIGVGTLAQRYVGAAEAGGVRAVDGGTPEAAAQLARKLDFDILLVKGSRGCGLDRAVQILIDREGL